MQPCSREIQGMASSLNGISSANTATSAAAAAQIALQELQNGHQQQIQNPNTIQVHDDFFDQMLSTLPSWPDLGNPKSPWDNSAASADGSNGHKLTASDGLHYAPYDESTLLASRLRQHQISGGGGGGSAVGKPGAFQLNHQQQQQMLLSSIGRSPAAAAGGESGLMPLPLSLGSGGSVDSRLLVDRSRDDVEAAFKSPNSTGGEGALYNGFAGSLQRAAQAANQQHFHHPQGGTMAPQNFGGAPAAAGTAAGGGAAVAAPPRQRVRARRGQATDPHSIAERLRRERIADRMKALQELVPNANKTDKASMLDEIIDYVKFLQLQVKVLSMSRLGGAAAVAPLVADISSEGQGGGRGGSNSSSGTAASDSLTVTEHQVAKLMEEDMGSAMQYLQGKGLCLMPISLASAISTATCHPRGPTPTPTHPLLNPSLLPNINHTNHIAGGAADAPSSPSLSVLTVQSAVAGGAANDAENVSRSSVKDAASVSKP